MEERPGEEHATQEETQENSGEEVTKKPPNIDCEEVHNNDGESGEALQPSMTNVGTLNELIVMAIYAIYLYILEILTRRLQLNRKIPMQLA